MPGISRIWKAGVPARIALIILLLAMSGFVVFFQTPDKDPPYSTVLFSADGRLLGGRIAKDGQWRFPGSEEVPEKFTHCILHFEDRWFFHHPGVNPVSVLKAAFRNLKAGRIVSGASTLTMQWMRLSGDKPERNVWQKSREALMALRAELCYSKEEILQHYCSLAPFGGNIVGLEAASWRYFACPPADLSWGESAGLAVLPNAPSLVYPGKNEALLMEKRNALLRKLYLRGVIDSLTYVLSSEEPLPSAPEPLPDLAPHLLERLRRKAEGQRIQASLDYDLQTIANRISAKHAERLQRNNIHNMAILVVDQLDGRVLVYIGNANHSAAQNNAVDMIQAQRSPGSILKPFLYAAMLDAGMISPFSLVPDLPIHFSGYSPKNFDLQFRGAVPADQALSQSLNLPAVWMLREYGTGRFLELLRRLGFSSLRQNADHYGLSLILGGAEVRMDELLGAYGGMGISLGRVPKGELVPPFLNLRYTEEKEAQAIPPGDPVIRPSTVYTTLEALKKVNRPAGEAGWQGLASSSPLAWKTGTSFGFRDAWAVGMDARYLVGVWAGNASGEGVAGLTGSLAAAPILFDIFSLLPRGEWFSFPAQEMREMVICRQSGHLAGLHCPERDTLLLPVPCLQTPSCPYHTLLALDTSRHFRVRTDCYPTNQIIQEAWFILPPAMATFYRRTFPYADPPPFWPGCRQEVNERVMEFVYPGPDLMVFLPRDGTSERGAVVLEAAHQQPGKGIFWHLDGVFLGQTRHFHTLLCQPDPGEHLLVLVDEDGNTIQRRFKAH